jgi:hypothetical protein
VTLRYGPALEDCQVAHSGNPSEEIRSSREGCPILDAERFLGN